MPIFTGSKIICGQSMHTKNPSSDFKKREKPKTIGDNYPLSITGFSFESKKNKMIKYFVILFSLDYDSCIFSTGPIFGTSGIERCRDGKRDVQKWVGIIFSEES